MRLIVNADDYGCTVPVSLGILEGMKYGIVTSTSAIVPGAFFFEMAEYAQEHGVTHMGLHCMLTMLKPTLPSDKVKTLVKADGVMFNKAELFAAKVDIDEARAEIENQIRLFLSTGLKLDHFDSHHGLLMKSKEFMDLFLSLAEEYKVPIRNSMSRVQNELSAYGLSELKRRGVKTTDFSFANLNQPYHTDAEIIDFFENHKKDYATVEMVSHCGHSDAFLRSISILNDDREHELEAVLSTKVKDYLQENNIELISFREL